ncbi:MAG: hypothetical protein ABSG32_19505 [Terriglobia bacterium]|jgi:hypothetical protein
MTKRSAIQVTAIAILMGLANMIPTDAHAKPRGDNTQCRERMKGAKTKDDKMAGDKMAENNTLRRFDPR